jgi:hypothetical protein
MGEASRRVGNKSRDFMVVDLLFFGLRISELLLQILSSIRTLKESRRWLW